MRERRPHQPFRQTREGAMLQIRTILFPTDFSPCAEHALAHAAFLARAHGAALHALYAHVPGDDVNCPDEPAGRPWPQVEGAEVVHAVREGDAVADVILTYAGEHDIDLIAMGTHGRTGLQHAMLGSVAEKVVRLASCPVLTVPERAPELADGAASVARVLAPVDFSRFGRAALAHAKALAALFEARLDVLHVVQQATVPAAYGLDPVLIVPPEVLDRSREALADFVREVPGSDVPTEIHVELGYPASNIIDFAEHQKSDLVVVATHGLTGLKRFLLGSVAERVVRTAPCAVFTVRSFGRQLLPADVLASLEDEGT